jgi:hypothetical protein
MSEQNPEQLRRKARDILADAERARDPDSRGTLTRMAASYIQMARQLEELGLRGSGRWDMTQQQPQQQAQSGDKN